jgi:hypothetical protein
VGFLKVGEPCREGRVVEFGSGQAYSCRIAVRKEHFVAAVWAIVSVVVVFGALNLLEYRRFD